MKKWTPISLAVLAILATAPVWAQNPEDEPLEDLDAPAAVAPTSGSEGTTASVGVADGLPAGVTLDGAPSNNTTSAQISDTSSASSGETVTIPREVWEQLQRDVAELKASRAAIATTSTSTAVNGAEVEASDTPAPPRNYLTLPDISLVLQAKGLLSSDKRDEELERVGFSEGELTIGGYVYPNVRADAFIVGAPAEDEFGFEEAFLTFEGVRKGLNVNVGRKFVPFGRTGELHNHSWLYPRQVLPIRNLVGEEALVGDGVNLHYLFPTKGKLFLRGSLGFFNGEGTETGVNLSDPGDPFFGGLPLGKDGEIELGVSHARGKSSISDDAENSFDGRVNLSGVDLSYRKFMNNGKRLLLRGEYFKYKPRGLPTTSADGYYALANMKLDARRDIGLLYEKSDFPNAPGQRENALSLLFTKQLTEQFYVRLMGTRGERAGDSYNELRLQFTAGLGPHTHSLE